MVRRDSMESNIEKIHHIADNIATELTYYGNQKRLFPFRITPSLAGALSSDIYVSSNSIRFSTRRQVLSRKAIPMRTHLKYAEGTHPRTQICLDILKAEIPPLWEAARLNAHNYFTRVTFVARNRLSDDADPRSRIGKVFEPQQNRIFERRISDTDIPGSRELLPKPPEHRPFAVPQHCFHSTGKNTDIFMSNILIWLIVHLTKT